MSTPTNIPETAMGETDQDSFVLQIQGKIPTATSGHLPDNPEVDWARSI